MTRVNLVPPAELFDQHLMAEYRELLMIPASLSRTLHSRKGLRLDEYPKRFTLNRGHVSFFYNKGRYLEQRYAALVRELTRRGFRLDPERLFPSGIFIEHGLYNDWLPDAEDLTVIRARIAERLAQRPDWYRKTSAGPSGENRTRAGENIGPPEDFRREDSQGRHGKP